MLTSVPLIEANPPPSPRHLGRGCSRVVRGQSSGGSGGGAGVLQDVAYAFVVFLQEGGGGGGSLARLQPGPLCKGRIWSRLPSLPPPPPLVLPRTAILSSQPENLRAALNPLSPRCQTQPPPPTQRCFCAEISGRGAVCVLGQTCPSFDTGADSDSDSGLRTKITPSRLPGFLLNPLQHMTCVTATDLHRKIPPVEGQGRNARGGEEQHTGAPLAPVFTNGLFKKFIFLKYLAHFMVL